MDYEMFAKGNRPAYPNERQDGLTKRELFAAMALQGLIAAGATYNVALDNAVEMADDLIKKLNTP